MREVTLDEWQEVQLQPPRAPPLSQAPVGELLAQEEVRRFSQLMSWQLQRGRSAHGAVRGLARAAGSILNSVTCMRLVSHTK